MPRRRRPPRAGALTELPPLRIAAQQPPLRRVTSKVIPSEDHLEAERRPRDEGGEEEEEAGGEIVESL